VQVERLRDPLTAEEIFWRLSSLPHCLFLDSAMKHPTLGRYSFVAADPFAVIRCPVGDAGALTQLREALRKYSSPTHEGIPPFQGGAAGLLGYDLNQTLADTPRPKFDDFKTPALHVGLYDTVISFDHVSGEAWLVSQGFPELDDDARRDRAAARSAQFREWLECRGEPVAIPTTDDAGFDEPALLDRSFPTSSEGVLSNFESPGYRDLVARGIELINAGDIFQVNLSQRLLCRASDDSRQLYLRLRKRNAATFSGYYDCGDRQIVSASPERFLCLRDGRLETRPIKGTRPRTKTPEADLFAASDLRNSEKDRAENVMIVDLLRNDLSRVCDPDSVVVDQLCQLEAYEFVQHLVSAVSGRLTPEADAIAAVEACFPGGSITGAPKIRAMEIIAELEQTARGAYCGSLGYVGFDGTMDLSILIRTVTASHGWWQFPVGGGVVSQSTPDNELQETWQKAAGVLRALRI
jgi:para-aminobenzoate synthetase component 1